MGLFKKLNEKAESCTDEKAEIQSLSEKLENYDERKIIDIRKLAASHEIELKEKEFELKHFKDEEIQELRGKIVELEKQLAVQEERNAQLKKVIDLDADIVDVKDLINKLIGKLPDIKIGTLPTSNNDDSTSE